MFHLAVVFRGVINMYSKILENVMCVHSCACVRACVFVRVCVRVCAWCVYVFSRALSRVWGVSACVCVRCACVCGGGGHGK